MKRLRGTAIALALTVAAWGTGYIWSALLRGVAGPRVALGLGLLIGYGLVGYLAATQSPRPSSEALGLRAFRPAFLLPVALLGVAFIPALQLQAAARGLAGRPGATGIYEWGGHLVGTGSALDLLLTFTVVGLIAPLAAEWFFRGVLHERLVSSLGPGAGFLAATAFYAMTVAGLRMPPAAWINVFLSACLWGAVLVGVRRATGSVLASGALHVLMNLVYAAFVAGRDNLAVPGVTAPLSGGALVPGLAASVAAVAGLVLLAVLSRSPARSGA